MASFFLWLSSPLLVMIYLLSSSVSVIDFSCFVYPIIVASLPWLSCRSVCSLWGSSYSRSLFVISLLSPAQISSLCFRPQFLDHSQVSQTQQVQNWLIFPHQSLPPLPTLGGGTILSLVIQLRDLGINLPSPHSFTNHMKFITKTC